MEDNRLRQVIAAWKEAAAGVKAERLLVEGMQDRIGSRVKRTCLRKWVIAGARSRDLRARADRVSTKHNANLARACLLSWRKKQRLAAAAKTVRDHRTVRCVRGSLHAWRAKAQRTAHLRALETQVGGCERSCWGRGVKKKESMQWKSDAHCLLSRSFGIIYFGRYPHRSPRRL